ncbi:serine hydrolase domain-containing protein [Ornithinimicrobium flavum]|uniref:serine hydrolase domain-containing protein n=1 Tax=Ornithinimicrobium flavum TaxID=1288636 RepID=UPI0013053EAD|nr:serine hydrolase domain-containing protein [Ornithinimicrobium flavum]
MTIRQLLEHTSGAPNGSLELLLRHIEDPTSLEQQLEALGRDYADQEHIDAINDVPWTAPGQFVYSNAGYVALGMLVEEATGRSVEDLLRERVFGPAGMRHSSYPDEPGLNGPVLREDAWVGETWEGGWWDLDGFDPDVFSHAGAVVSTTADLAAFNEALLTGELVGPEVLQEMLTPTAASGFYGLGVYAVLDPCSTPEDPQLLWGHDGASFGTLSIVLGSADGTRQIAIGATGRDLSALVPRWDVGDLLVPALLATC